MRALVTGSAGFIGSHLVDRLRADGWDVVGIDRRTGPSIQQANDPVGLDAIFHLAAPVGPVGVLAWAGRLVPEVIETSQIVAGWAIANRCPLIDVSTSEVYGSGSEDRETDDCHFAPETSARKEYAVAKLAAETMLLNTAGLDVRIVRPFNVAGPGQSADGGFVLPRFIAQALAGEPLTLYPPGNQRRAFTHVFDIADGLVAAYARGISGEVYNLCRSENVGSMFAMAELVIAVTGSRSAIQMIDPVTLHGSAFREAREKFGDSTKARLELDWQPWRSRLDCVRDAVAAAMVQEAA